MVSTAYSGMPSARATDPPRRRSGGPGASPAAAAPSPASASGSRSSAGGCGRSSPSRGVSMSSGRARASTKIGRVRAQSSRCSMKSSRPAVGPVEVLEDEHAVPVVREALEEGAPGGEELLALRRLEQRRGPAGRERGARPAPARRRPGGTARASGELRRGPSAGRRSRRSARAADHLAQRPERDAVAVGGRAALVPEHRLDHAVQVLLELPREPALADAGRPVIDTRRGRRSRAVAWNGP